MWSSVELSKSRPVEVNNSIIELHLPVDSQCSLPAEALNLIVKSKSIGSFIRENFFFLSAFSSNFSLSFREKMLPFGVNCRLIWTLSYIWSLRRKKSLQSYCSVDFDFLCLMRSYHNTDYAAIWHDLWWHVAWLHVPVSVNSQIRCSKFPLLLVLFKLKS